MKCAYCGKTIMANGEEAKDRRCKFCSDECRKAANREYRKEYHKLKYGVDERYTESHLQHSSSWNKVQREKRRTKMYEDFVDRIATMTSKEEIISFIEDNYRLTRRLK